MNYNIEKIDEVVLALLYLTYFSESTHYWTWKGQDWEALSRLYEKGFISDPKSKSKSVVFSDEGFEQSKNLFKKYFELWNWWIANLNRNITSRLKPPVFIGGSFE